MRSLHFDLSKAYRQTVKKSVNTSTKHSMSVRFDVWRTYVPIYNRHEMYLKWFLRILFFIATTKIVKTAAARSQMFTKR